MVHIFPHSDWMRENTAQKNSEYEHFTRTAIYVKGGRKDQKSQFILTQKHKCINKPYLKKGENTTDRIGF